MGNRGILPNTSGPHIAMLSMPKPIPLAMEQNAAQVRAGRRSLGNLPLVVITAGAGHDNEAAKNFWFEKQHDLLTLSSNSQQILVPEATHLSLIGTDASVVVDAFREVVEPFQVSR